MRPPAATGSGESVTLMLKSATGGAVFRKTENLSPASATKSMRPSLLMSPASNLPTPARCVLRASSEPSPRPKYTATPPSWMATSSLPSRLKSASTGHAGSVAPTAKASSNEPAPSPRLTRMCGPGPKE